MKRILKIAAVALVIMLGSSWRSDLSAQPYPPDDYGYNQDDEITYQEFYDELSPHGRWVDHPQYGYVWIPNAGPDFRPYSSNGHWVYTDNYEWMWVSDYDWGWAPFHYGRWDYDPYYSWYWVPGYEWAPAWVAWRDGGDYYGWAPLRPGISISINFSIGSYRPPYDFWCFTPRRYILYPRVYDYCVDRRQNVTIINNTTIINNYSYNRNIFMTGPRRSSVEVYTGRITPVRFRESSRAGRTTFRNNEVRAYRPSVQRDANRRFSPRSFERYDRSGNGARIERNSNGQSNSGRIERRDVNTRRNDNVSAPRNGNNLPQRERANSPFERRNQPGTSQQQRNMPNRMERPQQGQRNDDRITGQRDRQLRTNPGFERRNDQPVMRQPQERRENPVRNMPQRNERRNDQPVMRQQQERREAPGRSRPQMNERRQQQQQQFERREAPTRTSPQVNERRQEQQPRQMERRDNGGGGERTNGNGRGNGRGRGN